MEKILFLSSSYLPNASANGVCISKVAQSLTSLGKEVHIFSVDKRKSEYLIDNIHVFSIKSSLILNSKNKFLKIIYYFSLALHVFVYPLFSFIYLLRIYFNVKKLHLKNHYKVIISGYLSLENCVAASIIKKKYPNHKSILYVLDSFSSSIKSKYLPQIFVKKMNYFWERMLFKIYDRILIMYSQKEHYNTSQYAFYNHKIFYTDFPLMSNHFFDNNKDYNKNNFININYFGSLDSLFRNPEYTCLLFSKFKSNLKYSINFYSKGDGVQILEKYKYKIKNFFIHGFYPHDEIKMIQEKTDVFISIGNQSTTMVPSKIFEYMSYGKKIIHFFKDKNDSSLQYLKKYPNVLIVEQNLNNISDNIKKIEFFLSTPTKLINKNQMMEIFTMNYPEYTSNLILL